MTTEFHLPAEERNYLRRLAQQQAEYASLPIMQERVDAFAEATGSAHAIGCNSGTDALILALRGLGIGPGDEVIVPANSFVASAEAVSTCGATVVFCDAHPTSYNIDPRKLTALIGPKTKAIVPVHYAGVACDMDEIMELAQLVTRVEKVKHPYDAGIPARKGIEF